MAKKQIGFQIATGYVPSDLDSMRSEIQTLQKNGWEVLSSEVGGIHENVVTKQQEPYMVISLVKYGTAKPAKAGRPKKEKAPA